MQLAMYMYAEEGVKNILLFNELCSLFQLLVPYFSFIHTSSFRLVVQLAVYVSYTCTYLTFLQSVQASLLHFTAIFILFTQREGV